MTSARFLIFGAHRDSGKPASLVLEAASRDEAVAFALEQGILIQQVQELPSAASRLEARASSPATRSRQSAPIRPSPEPPAHSAAGEPIAPEAHRPEPAPEPEESPPPAAPARSMPRPSLKRIETPSLRLPWPREFEGLAGEQVLATYEPRGLELGLLGPLLGRRAKVLLTTHRFIVSQRRIFGGSVATARLESLSGITLGSRVSTWLMALGLGGLLLTIPLFALAGGGSSSLGAAIGGLTTGSDDAQGLLGPIQGLLSGAQSGVTAFLVLQAVASIAMMVFAWNRELAAVGSAGSIALRGRMINASRAAALVAATERAVHLLDPRQSEEDRR